MPAQLLAQQAVSHCQLLQYLLQCKQHLDLIEKSYDYTCLNQMTSLQNIIIHMTSHALNTKQTSDSITSLSTAHLELMSWFEPCLRQPSDCVSA